MYIQLGNERDSLLRKFRRVHENLLPVLFVLLVFLLVDKTIFNQQSSEREVGMSGPWSWEDLLLTYFALGEFPKMRDKAPYRGARDPQVSMTRCRPKGAPMCSEICSNRRLDGSWSETEVCIYTNNERVRQCWETKHMRCWNSDYGGNDVFDGSYEWTLLRHVIETDLDFSWLHLRSSERRVDFFVFSSEFRGDKRSTVNEICTRLLSAHGLQMRFHMIPKDHVAVLSGHDEGSGWALCGNEYLRRGKFPQMRRVIVTGALLTDPRLSHELEADLRVNGKVLLAATIIHSQLVAPFGLLPDVFLLFNQAGVTLPQFGYACLEEREDYDISCIDPQPDINLADGLSRVNSMAGLYMLYDIHSFEFYRRCFYACLAVFERREESFSFNIRGYAREITPNEASPIADDLQRPDEHTFGGTGGEVSRPHLQPASSSHSPERMQSPEEWREAYGSDHTTKSDDELQEIDEQTKGFHHSAPNSIEPLDLHQENLPLETLQEYQRPLSPENTFQRALTPEYAGAVELKSETPDSSSDLSEDSAVVREKARFKQLLSQVDVPDSDASQASSSRSESTFHTPQSPSEPGSSSEHR